MGVGDLTVGFHSILENCGVTVCDFYKMWHL